MKVSVRYEDGYSLLMPMSTWFYYDNNGQKQGPITDGQLKGLAEAGQITPETIIETEEGKTAPARKVTGLTFIETVQSAQMHYEVAPFAEQNPFTAEERNSFQSFGGNYGNVSEPIMRGFRDPGWTTFITAFLIVLLLVMNVVSISGNIMERDVLLKI